MECMGVASGSGWNLWVWLLGVVVRRYIDFLILLIPTPLVSVLFYSSIPTFPTFVHFFKMFVLIMGSRMEGPCSTLYLQQVAKGSKIKEIFSISSSSSLSNHSLRAIIRALHQACPYTIAYYYQF